MATKRQLCVCLYCVILVLIALATLNLFISKLSEKESEKIEMTEKFVSVDFEVFGRVQGVFFRKYTKQKGDELKLVGWCMNTDRDTVVGQMQGEDNKVRQMKVWLETKGSPLSAIERAVFSNEQRVKELSFDKFRIRQ
ncbi:acylphosphatase-1-like [Lycorma delicatula]|uniref:acylphosphatase-1-like n=1 Tax=Lycorma delicatula TaxID=130591 RepID=UPI003F5161C1